MYFFHILPFIWLGLTDYCSSQWANLDAQLEDEFPPSAPQNRLNVDSRIVFDPIDYGARVSSPESSSPEVPIANQAEIIQACPYNSYELSPTKRRLKREWCRDDELAPNDSPATINPKPPSSSVQEDRPKDGSEAGQLEGGEKTPSTNINPQLPSIPGREQLPGQHDSNPCNEAGINPVCSPFYVSQVFYPLSLVWKATWLEFCRIYYPGQGCLAEGGEKLYCCHEVRNELPAPPGKSLWYYKYRAKYPITGRDCVAVA